jgi:hypothetical protein
MEEILKIATITTTISGIIVTIAIYFFKKSIDSFLESKLENHKLKLSKELFEFQTALEKSKETKYLVFKSLHEERAEAIKNIFKKMVHFFDSYRGWVMGIRDSVEQETINEWYKQHMDKQVELVQFMDENRIFFHSSLTKIFDDFQAEIYELNMEGNRIFNKEFVVDIPVAEGINDINNKMKEYLEMVIATFGPNLDKTEAEFKKVIGVE